MSKLEEYQKAKKVAERVMENYRRSARLDSAANDKGRIECKLDHMARSDFTPAILSFHAHHGYFGNSGCTSDMDVDTAVYVARAITERGKEIMRRAAQMAAADAEAARKAAEDEAREVLGAVAQ
jgi:hypothetical protein